MTKKKNEKNENSGVVSEDISVSGPEDPFLLETLFPDAHDLFKPSGKASAIDKNTIVLPDTNALLLPYEINSGNLQHLATAFEKLATEKRLFVPERVVREFARWRERKLADMVQALHQKKQPPKKRDMPPILEGIGIYTEANTRYETLENAYNEYVKTLDGLVSQIEAWRGNDPVTITYEKLFNVKTIVKLPDDEESRKKFLIEKEWRYTNRVAPGYADNAKPDGGIGDFLIWKSILKVAAEQKKDLVFITGEQKGDWLVRSGNAGLYPKPELIDEYRRASGGKTFRMLSLHGLLAELQLPEAVIESVKTAEEEANTEIQNVRITRGGFGETGRQTLGRFGKVSFDYSTNNGRLSIGKGDDLFELRFSKADNRSIHMYVDGTNIVELARVKKKPLPFLSLRHYDTSSRIYTISIDEYFVVRNHAGRMMLGRILDIKDDSRGDDRDEVTLQYRTTRLPSESIATSGV